MIIIHFGSLAISEEQVLPKPEESQPMHMLEREYLGISIRSAKCSTQSAFPFFVEAKAFSGSTFPTSQENSFSMLSSNLWLSAWPNGVDSNGRPTFLLRLKMIQIVKVMDIVIPAMIRYHHQGGFEEKILTFIPNNP